MQHMPGGAISPLNPSFKSRAGGLTFGRRQRMSDGPAGDAEDAGTVSDEKTKATPRAGEHVSDSCGHWADPVAAGRAAPAFRRRGSSQAGVEAALDPTEGEVEGQLQIVAPRKARSPARAQTCELSH